MNAGRVKLAIVTNLPQTRCATQNPSVVGGDLPRSGYGQIAFADRLIVVVEYEGNRFDGLAQCNALCTQALVDVVIKAHTQ